MDDDIDTDRIDDAVLALLLLGRHDGMRAWKGFNWDALDRLHKTPSLRRARDGQGRAPSAWRFAPSLTIAARGAECAAMGTTPRTGPRRLSLRRGAEEIRASTIKMHHNA
jgi:hypothetical protein